MRRAAQYPNGTGEDNYRGKRQRQHRDKDRGWSGQAQDWRELFCCKVATIEEARALEKKAESRGAAGFLADRKTNGLT